MEIPILSIILLTVLAWMVRRAIGLNVCPICAGVSGTWLWMLVAREAGFSVDAIALAILMGGSVVGVTYLIERHLPIGRSQVLFKALAVPVGFVGVWAVIQQFWGSVVVAVVIGGALSACFLRRPKRESVTQEAIVSEAERRIKECC